MKVQPSRSRNSGNLSPFTRTLQSLQEHRYATLAAALLLVLSLGYGFFSGSTETTSADSSDEEFIDLGEFSESAPAKDLKPIPSAPATVSTDRFAASRSAWELEGPGVQSANLTIPLELTPAPAPSAPVPPGGSAPAWLIGTIETVDDPVAEAPREVERISFDGPLLLPR